MAKQKGRDVLVKLNTTGTTFVAIGGGQEVTVTIANEAVDVTTADDVGVRQLLEGAGVNSVSIKCQGLYIDNQNQDTLRSAALTNTHKKLQVVFPGTAPKTLEGMFMIASFEDGAKFNEAMTYNITLESAGAISLT